jgi:GNAT superfamily N-acetyltransferase
VPAESTPIPKLARVDEVIDVMCDAFRDYPVMRFVLGGAIPGPDDPRLRKLVTLFVSARELRGEPMLAIEDDGRAVGAATVTLPGSKPSPPAFLELRERTWAELGADCRARYDVFAVSGESFYPTEPHHHLNMLGVRRSHAGRGLARPLLEAVHALADADPNSVGVTLSTENPDNVPLYEHFGYMKRGFAAVSQVKDDPPVSFSLDTWVLFRAKR